MNQPAFGSELRRHRRERVLAAAEAVEGVVAASADFSHDGVLESVRVVALPSADAETITHAVSARLGEHGFRFEPGRIDVRRMGVSGNGPARDSAPIRAAEATHEDAPSGTGPHAEPEGQEPGTTTPPTNGAAARSQPARAPKPADRPHLQLVENEGTPPPWHGRFLVLDAVEVERRHGRVLCRVRITRLGETFTAEAEDIDSPSARARCAARAALMAAQQAGEGIQLSLEGIVIEEFFGRQYVAAFVDAAANRRWNSLCGILSVDNSLETSAVLAILRAVERWVAW